MHRYLTIYQLITIQEYNKNYKYSIGKIAKAIDSNKYRVQRTLILLNQNLTPLQILEQQAINKHKSSRKNNPKSVSTKTLSNMFKKKLHGFDEKHLLRKGRNKPHKTQENSGKFAGSKSTDLSVYTQKQLDEVALIINSTPRKILNYKKPLDLAPLF